MSKIARWTYKSTAKVKPFLGIDEWGGKSYGPEYDIACTWIAAESEERNAGGQSGAQGVELVLKHEVFTENARPKYQDMILLDGLNEWEEIRQRQSYDMAMFNDTMDFKLVTA